MSWSLAANFEALTLTGPRNGFAGGNSRDNTLNGNDALNTLAGRDGDDTLNGRGGADNLWGGAGADRFVFDTALGADNVDRVRDFVVGEDTIVLDHGVFGALAAGPLAAGALQVGGSIALTRDAHILYQAVTGALLSTRMAPAKRSRSSSRA